MITTNSDKAHHKASTVQQDRIMSVYNLIDIVHIDKTEFSEFKLLQKHLGSHVIVRFQKNRNDLGTWVILGEHAPMFINAHNLDPALALSKSS
jgi:hypothetical protein